MKYWDAILHEVVNKNKKSTRFHFTNLGEHHSTAESSASKTLVKQVRKNISYPVGKEYPDINFTFREAQCMVLILKGHTMQSAGMLLQLSPRTV